MSQSLRGSTVTNYFKFSLAGTSTIVLYSFKSPWASLCPCANTCCVRGVASARPRRASKRLDCRLWKRDLFHQHNRKGKIVMIETSRYKGLVFWVRFWHLKLIWFLETELGPPLFEALIANAVFLCDADALLHWNSAAEEGAWGGLKTGPPRRHQIQVEGPQFWTNLVQTGNVFNGRSLQKTWTSKVVGGSSFGNSRRKQNLKKLQKTSNLRGSTVTNYFKFSLAGTSTIVLYSFKSPWASLCPCANTCWRPRQWPRPGLACWSALSST